MSAMPVLGHDHWLPTYLKSARGFSWAEMGWLASLPFVLSIFSKAAAGIFVDKIGRSAPILMVLMFFAGVSIYFGTVTEHKYMSAVLLSFAVAFCTMGTPLLDVITGNDTGKIYFRRQRRNERCRQWLVIIIPVFIGLFIAITGTYAGGLLCPVFISAIAVLSALILTIKNINHEERVMKITSVDIIDVANDFASATSKWRPVVVKINTDEGISGFGEVGLAYGVGASAGIGMAKI